MEFKGCVTEYSKSSLQGITDGEITILLNDLEKMVPEHAPTWTKQGRNKEHGQGKLW